MLSGSCLCGAVTFEINGELEHQPEACHCSQCRKVSGHFLAAVNVKRSNLSLRGQDHIACYPSSDKVDRGFCKTCGSTLFWRPNMDGYEYTAIAMGLFDGPTGAGLRKHTFVGDRGDYYEISDGVPQSDEF